METFVVVTFYKFTPLPHYQDLKAPLLSVMKEKNVKGTIILAEEGVNGTFCAQLDNAAYLMDYLKQQEGLKTLSFQQTWHDVNPFAKAKVKLRKEIVTMGETDVSPLSTGGKHVSPEEWNALLADPNVLVVDTRNDYEVKLGTFKGAINPETDNFRDFPAYVKTHLMDKKEKKIAMFCTGGIRCEKSTAYLKDLGFEEVYQLKGGILNYLEGTTPDKSLWQGTCFVFDDRVALDSQLNSLAKGSIDSDWKNNNKKKALNKE